MKNLILKLTNNAKYQQKWNSNFVCVCVLLLINFAYSQNEIQFPVEVGVKPESITKGFNGNYYVW